MPDNLFNGGLRKKAATTFYGLLCCMDLSAEINELVEHYALLPLAVFFVFAEASSL